MAEKKMTKKEQRLLQEAVDLENRIKYLQDRPMLLLKVAARATAYGYDTFRMQFYPFPEKTETNNIIWEFWQGNELIDKCDLLSTEEWNIEFLHGEMDAHDNAALEEQRRLVVFENIKNKLNDEELKALGMSRF